jgi:hypothetical protein
MVLSFHEVKDKQRATRLRASWSPNRQFPYSVTGIAEIVTNLSCIIGLLPKGIYMCNYQTVFHDDAVGYIVKCRACEKLQVGFNNLVMTFSIEEFEAFKNWIGRIKDNCVDGQDERVRSVVIPTPCEGMKLLLSPKELNSFNNMLEAADSELKSLELLKLFEA